MHGWQDQWLECHLAGNLDCKCWQEATDRFSKKNTCNDIWPISSLLTLSFSVALVLGVLHHHPANRRHPRCHPHAHNSCVLTCGLRLSALLWPLPSPWAQQAPHLWLLSWASAGSWAGMENGWVLDCKRLIGQFCLKEMMSSGLSELRIFHHRARCPG